MQNCVWLISDKIISAILVRRICRRKIHWSYFCNLRIELFRYSTCSFFRDSRTGHTQDPSGRRDYGNNPKRTLVCRDLWIPAFFVNFISWNWLNLEFEIICACCNNVRLGESRVKWRKSLIGFQNCAPHALQRSILGQSESDNQFENPPEAPFLLSHSLRIISGLMAVSKTPFPK